MSLTAAAGFCRRLGTGFRAGVDLISLLRAEAKSGPAAQREALTQVADGLAQGNSLTDMLKQQSHFFPPLLVSMAHVGEATGRLERTLLSLADHYDHRVSTRRLFLIGIAWPVIQLVAAIMVIGLLIWLLGVLAAPGGAPMFDPLGFGLRGTSGALLYFGMVLTVLALLLAAIYAAQRNFLGIHNVVPVLYLIPALGPAIRTITLSRFCWTLALTLDAGLDPISSVRLALESTGSDYYRSGIQQAEQSIRQGNSLSESLRSTHLLPDEFLTKLEVAELSGTDAESLDALAQDYDARARMAVRTLAGLATAIVWISVVVILVALILRMAFRIFAGMHEATQF